MMKRMKILGLALIAVFAVSALLTTASTLLENPLASFSGLASLLLVGAIVARGASRNGKTQQRSSHTSLACSQSTVSRTNQVATATGTPNPEAITQPIARLPIPHERKAQTFNLVMAC